MVFGDSTAFRVEKQELFRGFSLNAGEAVEKTCGLDWWGDLPAGTYRLVKEIHRGTISENTFVRRYLTVEFEIQ